MLRSSLSLLVGSLGMLVLSGMFVISVQAQVHVDRLATASAQVSSKLVIPQSTLQEIRPELLVRIKRSFEQTDTSLATIAGDLSIDVNEVAFLVDGSQFHKINPRLPVPGPPLTTDESVFEAPYVIFSNPALGPSTRGRLLMRSLQNGFVMGEEPSIFQTTLQIWLMSDEEDSPIPLAAPVQVILAVDDAVSIEASPVYFTHFNDVAIVHVQANPKHDTLTVSMGLPTQNKPPVAVLNVHRPMLIISANPDSIEGFGIGESHVTVQVPDTYPSNVELVAATQAATARPAFQIVGPGKTAVFKVRSWGVGEETIKIMGGPSFAQDGRSVSVYFFWPVYFILFILAGSLIGGGIRYYRLRSSLGKETAKLPSILVSGFLIGVVAGSLYVIGISLFPIIPAGVTGQIVVMVVSSAAAVTGPTLPFEGSVSAD